MRLTLASIALCFALLFSLVQVGLVVAPTQNDMGTGGDAGGTFDTASLISSGSGTGYLDSTDEYDYYKISVSSGQSISVSMTPSSGSDFDLDLYDSAQSYVDSSSSGGSVTDTVTYTATSSGYFYIMVSQWSGEGTYSMIVTVTGGGVTTQNDMGTGDDAGNSLSAATSISADSGTGFIDSTDTYDYYKVPVSSGQTVNVSMTPPSGSDFDIYLYDTSQAYADSSTYGGSSADTVEGTATASGYFYIYVYRYSGSGSYSMTVTVTGGTTQNDMGTGTDAGDDLPVATEIAPGFGTGYIDSTDEYDYYKVSVSSGQTVNVSMTPPSGSDFDIGLFDTDQTTDIDWSSYGGSQTDTVEGTATSSGYIYIKVYQYSGSGIYSMTVTRTGSGATQNDMGTGTDAGNSLSAAAQIAANTSGTGYIDTTDTHDYYKVSVTSGQLVSVSITPPSGSDFDLRLYDTNQSQVDSSTYGGSTTDTVEGTATSSGHFYIDVYQYSGSGIYSMIVTVTGGTVQNDMGTGTDAGNSLSAATAIPAGSGTGYIDSTDTADYYKVSVTSGQTVNVSMTPPSGSDFDLILYDTSQSQVDSSTYGGSQTDIVEATATSSGYFYIHVYQWSGQGIYSMTVTVTGGTAQDDMGTGMDAGNSLSAATTIPAGTGAGYLDDTDPADYYKVNVSTGQTINVDLTPPSGSDFDLTLYNSSQSYVDSSAYGSSQIDSVTATATSSGYFYIYVEQWSGSGIYSLTVTVTGGATQDDMGTGTDAGNSLSAATAIPAGSGTGYIDSTDTADYYKVSVTSGQTVNVSMTPPSGSDFDIYLYDTSQAYADSSTYGGSSADTVEGTATASGYFYIYVYRYSGQGIYSMTVTATGGTAQNDWNSGQDAGNSSAQAMMISTGAGTGYVDETDTDDYYKIQVGSVGATISATLVPPSGSDFDLYLYSPNQTEVDSSLLGESQTDTVSYDVTSAGVHYVRVHRYSGSGTYSLNVSVTSAGAEAESAHPYANNFDQTWTITRSGAGRIRAHFTQLDTENNWDYVYIYDEDGNLIESYTGSRRDHWTSWVDGSTIKIGLATDGSVTAYGFTVDRVETGAAVPVTPTTNVAVIVGINDYARINDLRYAVPDAQDWRNYLSGKGYSISSFLTDSQATEANIRTAITNAANSAGSNGTLVLVFSGHGTNASPGDAHAFVAYDAGYSNNSGYLTGTELRDLLANYSGRLFVFFDSCFSGGMNQSITSTSRYMTTTSTGAGYGYDESSYGNGAWTYWYLERGLVGQSFTTAEQAFDWALSNYPYSGDDTPQEFDGDASAAFNI